MHLRSRPYQAVTRVSNHGIREGRSRRSGRSCRSKHPTSASVRGNPTPLILGDRGRSRIIKNKSRATSKSGPASVIVTYLLTPEPASKKSVTLRACVRACARAPRVCSCACKHVCGHAVRRIGGAEVRAEQREHCTTARIGGWLLCPSQP
jgi:hypothetical protein